MQRGERLARRNAELAFVFVTDGVTASEQLDEGVSAMRRAEGVPTVIAVGSIRTLQTHSTRSTTRSWSWSQTRSTTRTSMSRSWSQTRHRGGHEGQRSKVMAAPDRFIHNMEADFRL